MAALTAALLAASAASTVSGYAASRRNATAAQQQGDYQAGIANQNATLADEQASDAIARGHEAEIRSRAASRGLAGAQRASFAAQGLSLDTGSPADVVEGDYALGELDALATRNNARRAAYGFETEAAQHRSQAGMARTAGRNTATAYRNQGVQTLLAGAGDLFNIYQQYGLNRSTPAKPKGTSQFGPSPFTLPRSYYPRY